MSTVGTVRVLIADDHSLFAKTLEALLAGTPGVEVVGVAEDGLEAVGLAVTLSPDVVLMDVEMPHLDGIAADAPAARARARDRDRRSRAPPTTRPVAQAAHEAGAKGYLTKDRIGGGLLPAAARGGRTAR